MAAADIRNLADEEVMQLVGRADPRAFELLYDRHGGAAFSLAYRMVGNRVTAEDISQEAFLSIWRSRHALRRRARQRAHLGARDRPQPRRSTRCAAASVHERRREPVRGHRGAPGGAGAHRRGGGPPRGGAHVRARSTRCRRTSAAMIELAYFGGFSHSQIAEHARRADRHDQGPDAPRAREAAPPARRASRPGDAHDGRARGIPRRGRRLPARAL